MPILLVMTFAIATEIKSDRKITVKKYSAHAALVTVENVGKIPHKV